MLPEWNSGQGLIPYLVDHFTLISTIWVNTRKDLYQSRFSRSVLSTDAMDLASANIE